MRRTRVALVVIALLAGLVWFFAQRDRSADADSATTAPIGKPITATKPTTPAVGPDSRLQAVPSQPGTPRPPGPMGFEQARAHAFQTFREGAQNVVQLCPKSATSPPKMQELVLVLSWNRDASTPAFQHFAVEAVRPAGPTNTLPDVTTACARRLVGMPMTLILSPEGVPESGRVIEERIMLPLP